jgi:4-hydroxythreonine-4-phosphate dehydrogenase
MTAGEMGRPLALTMGEPAGIGAEITLKAWAGRAAGPLPPFFVIDDPDRLRREAHVQDLAVPIGEIGAPGDAIDLFGDALPVLPNPMAQPVMPGVPDPANSEAVTGAIQRAVGFAIAGTAAGVVTNPIHKKVLADAGFPHPGHTEFLAELTGASTPVMMLACAELRVVPLTVHIPLRDVATALSTEMIVAKGRITARGLVEDFAIPRPRIAVAGFNPHSGEGGLLGSEETDIIAPAVEILQADGIAAEGPLPADSLFHAAARAGYDAVLCMYHDQALIPLKTIDFDGGVNVTLGLTIVRTSPDHGTAFDIAGQGRANPESLCQALRLAAEIARNRSQAASSGRFVA